MASFKKFYFFQQIFTVLSVLFMCCEARCTEPVQHRTDTAFVRKFSDGDVVVSGKVVGTRFDASRSMFGFRVYTAEVMVYCVYKGKATPTRINVHEVGEIQGYCPIVHLRLGHEYMLTLQESNGEYTIKYTPEMYNYITINQIITFCGIDIKPPADNTRMTCASVKEANNCATTAEPPTTTLAPTSAPTTKRLPTTTTPFVPTTLLATTTTTTTAVPTTVPRDLPKTTEITTKKTEKSPSMTPSSVPTTKSNLPETQSTVAPPSVKKPGKNSSKRKEKSAGAINRQIQNTERKKETRYEKTKSTSEVREKSESRGSSTQSTYPLFISLCLLSLQYFFTIP